MHFKILMPDGTLAITDQNSPHPRPIQFHSHAGAKQWLEGQVSLLIRYGYVTDAQRYRQATIKRCEL